MIKKLIISLTLLITLLFCSTDSFSQQKPKLVVGIVIDQMTNDYLQRFASRFSETGFKRLLKGGFYFKNSNYEYIPTFTAPGHTCIYTGTYPMYNGIIANDWYDRIKNENVYCADDKAVHIVGAGTPGEKYSPKNLVSSTVTDELINSDKNSRVISISLKERGSVFAGGHLGKSFWFDYVSGKFITSSYYMDSLPQWINDFNSKNLNAEYLTQTWNTLYPIETYTQSTADDVLWEGLFKGKEQPTFPYDLSVLKEKTPNVIEYTPYGNSILKELALATIQSEKLGEGSSTDFLCISFSSPDIAGHRFGPNSVEMEDLYLRLDKDLSEIFKAIDNSTGFENTLLFLTSDHAVMPVPGYLKSIGVLAGTVMTKNIRDTLNDYFEAKYGLADAVLLIMNLQIYLNHKAIAEKNLSLELIEKEAADFILDIEGIKETYTASGISSVFYNSENAQLIKNGFIKEKSGDVFIVLDSNWLPNVWRGTTHGSPYKYDRNAPLLWYGWQVQHGESVEFNSQCDIAPTVSDILKINMPSKNVGKSLRGIIVK